MNPCGVMALSLPTRVSKIATLSLSVLLSAGAPVHTQPQLGPRRKKRPAAL
jgi:hypothetical protein